MYKILILAFVILLNTLSFAQNERKPKHDYYFFDDDYFRNGKPAIVLTYGYSNTSLKNSGITIQNSGLIEFELGYDYIAQNKKGIKIVKYKDNFLFGSYISTNLNPSKDKANDEVNSWRFGCGSSSGYGYTIGKKSSIILYNKNSLAWTRFEKGLMDDTITGISDNSTRINDFDKTFRFGTGTEAGIMIPLGGMVSLHAKFDRTIVFPRHLVWKNLGSMIIEGIGQTAIDGFIKAILKTSPEAVPVVNFILKNGLSYGLYELKREKMNWPFQSAEPMLFDSFKAGITFVF